MKRLVFAAIVATGALASVGAAAAVQEPAAVPAAALEPTRAGVAASCGASYKPEGVDFCLLTGILLFDYDRVWPHDAPENLRFRVEYSLGAIAKPVTRLMTSANIIAHFAFLMWLDESYSATHFCMFFFDIFCFS